MKNEKNKFKKKYIILIIFIFLIILSVLIPETLFYGIPIGYIDKEEYYQEDGFQDYTDYAKYTYSSDIFIKINYKFRKLKEEDIDNIKGYFDNFDYYVRKEWASKYKFDKSIITEGDYVRIKTKEGEPRANLTYGKYDYYSIYLFDIETLTLYYIHNDI